MWKWQLVITRTYNTGNQDKSYTLTRTKRQAVEYIRYLAEQWQRTCTVNVSPDGCLLVALDGDKFARDYFNVNGELVGYTTLVATIEKIEKGGVT